MCKNMAQSYKILFNNLLQIALSIIFRFLMVEIRRFFTPFFGAKLQQPSSDTKHFCGPFLFCLKVKVLISEGVKMLNSLVV